MRSTALILVAIIGLSAAATIRTMNGKQPRKANDEKKPPQDALPPPSSFEDIFASEKKEKKDAEVLDAAKTKAAGKMEALKAEEVQEDLHEKTNAEQNVEAQKAEEIHEDLPGPASANEGLKNPIEAHEKSDEAPELPEMFVEGSPESALQDEPAQRVAARHPERENGKVKLQERPTTTPRNGNSSKRGPSSFSAASANSFSSGPNSHASSQAQAFSYGK